MMKTFNFLLLVFVLAVVSTAFLVDALNEARSCAFDEKMEDYKSQHPEKYHEMKNKLSNPSPEVVEHVHRMLRAQQTSVITVVFHILWNPQYTADPTKKVGVQTRINQEITYSNNWWKQQNPYYKDRSTYFESVVQTTPAPILFQLATIDDTGKPFQGYTETDTSITNCYVEPGKSTYYNTATGGRSPFDQTKFYNVWICDLNPTIAGYAYFPTDPPVAYDGAVFAHNQLASDSYGSTFVHEFLHYVAVEHTFAGGCSNTDGIADTPATSADAIAQFDSQCSGIPAGTTVNNYQSCGGIAMVENIMDYNQEPCIRYMTQGQVAKALTTLAQSPRNGLVAYSGTVPPPPPPVAASPSPLASPSQNAPPPPSPVPPTIQPSSSPACRPSCVNKQCGDNGCGGSCGVCLSSETCSTSFQCAAPAVTNGACTSATALSAGQTSVLLNNKPVSTNRFVSNCGAGISNITAPLWYSFTGSNNLVYANTCGGRTTVSTAISAFSGCPSGPTNCVAGNNNGCGSSSKLSFCARSGQTYYLAVGGASAAGQLDAYFNVSTQSCSPNPAPPPGCVPITCPANFCGSNGCGGVCVCGSGQTCLANGQCVTSTKPTNVNCGTATALTVTTAGVTASVDTTSIPQTLTATDCHPFPRADGAWYSFVGTGNKFTVTTCSNNTEIDTVVSVFSGSCTGLTCLADNDDDNKCNVDTLLSTATFCTKSGVTYYLNVRGYDSTGFIEFTVKDNGVACTPLATATCATASDFTSAAVVVDNTYAPITYKLPGCSTAEREGENLNNPSWHTFTAAQPNYYNVTTCSASTNFDTLIRVYKGDCPSNNLLCVNEDDDNPSCTANTLSTSVSVCATPGTKYYAAVVGYNNAVGTFAISAVNTGVACCQPKTPCPLTAACGYDDCGNACSASPTCPFGQTCSSSYTCSVPSVSGSPSGAASTSPAVSTSVSRAAAASTSPSQAIVAASTSPSPAAVAASTSPSPAAAAASLSSAASPSQGSYNVCISCTGCRIHKTKQACRRLSGTFVELATQICCNNLPPSIRTGPFSVTVVVRRSSDNAPRRQRTLRRFCAALGGSISSALRTSDGYYDWTCARS